MTTLLSQHDLRDDARTELLTVIDEESDRLNHLITQATEMARLDAREIHLDPREHDAREIVNAALLALTGTLAGQIVMEGFLNLRLKPWLRRLITRVTAIVPAVIVIAIGLDPLKILLLSQAALSFTLPFALVPLLILTQRAGVMGRFANGRVIQSLGWVSTTIILSLNGVLLWQSLAG